MEEQQKTVIVEKRVNKSVIRRRSRKLKPAPGEQQAVAAEKTTLEAVAPKKEIIEKPQEEKLEVVKAQKPKGRFVLSEEEKAKATEKVQSHIKKETKPKVVVAEVKEKVLESADEGVVIEAKSVKPKKEERPKVLSFKDRIRGHIDLKKPKVETAEEEQKKKMAGKPLTKESKEEELKEKQKKDKLLKAKKGVKTIGGDLDVEGLGRASTLAQLTRTSPTDRVFRPGETSRYGRKRKVVSKKNAKQTQITTKKASKRVIQIDQTIPVGHLAQAVGAKAGEIIKKLMDLGIMATINQEIDKETAALIVEEYQYEIKDVSFKEDQVLELSSSDQDSSICISRPPVVTIMGHVDHGKTSLLDKIKATNVASGEAGGITQHIGAYSIKVNENHITFLDTPGHEAFTAMRLRGAQATDIVVLVVAADDGMMPQTEESIDHARAAGVPIIVAVNKIDKPEADPEKIKRQLSEKGLVPEEWGGDVIFNNVSAKEGTGIDVLLESLLLQSEMLELKARSIGRAKGIVLEARLDRARGPVSTLLVQEGTLKAGDYIVAGYHVGRIKTMSDWQAGLVENALPSLAVEVLGIEGVPEAGDFFNVAESEKDARSVVDNRIAEKRRQDSSAKSQVTLEDMFSRMSSGEISELSIILKTDVNGSLEAIRDAVLKIGNEEVQAKIIHSGVGGVNESDVQLAMASKAIIIGFNVRPETKALHLAKDNGVSIKMYKVIYDLVNEVKLAMQGLLAPDIEETYLGRADVRQAFEVSKIGTIAGCMVTDGFIKRSANLRLLRDNVVLFEGAITSLKRFKDDAKDVKQGFECGIGIEGFGDIKSGDVIEAYEIKEIQKTL
ncbi:MAG: translation initiation factor IF-2 [bacterium]|nr:translation initiation factor IF-2 [bacterium]MBU1916709.1 translation initiation factor IF-2 [bacterium]